MSLLNLSIISLSSIDYLEKNCPLWFKHLKTCDRWEQAYLSAYMPRVPKKKSIQGRPENLEIAENMYCIVGEANGFSEQYGSDNTKYDVEQIFAQHLFHIIDDAHQYECTARGRGAKLHAKLHAKMVDQLSNSLHNFAQYRLGNYDPESFEARNDQVVEK